MIREMEDPISDCLRARLFVEAIGGLLPMFLKGEPSVVPAEQFFRLKLTTGDGFRGEIRVGDGDGDWPTVHLHFLSDAQLVALFTGRGLTVPLPFGGVLKLGRLRLFARAMRALEKRLKDVEGSDPLTVKLQFVSALLAIPAVVAEDRVAAGMVRKFTNGSARFQFQNGEALGPSLVAEKGGIRVQTERLDVSVDVLIGFRNPTILRQALNRDLDTMAALGLGDLRVDGLLPLGDQVNGLLDRAGVLLKSLT
jgi:hypothetical protein